MNPFLSTQLRLRIACGVYMCVCVLFLFTKNCADTNSIEFFPECVPTHTRTEKLSPPPPFAVLLLLCLFMAVVKLSTLVVGLNSKVLCLFVPAVPGVDDCCVHREIPHRAATVLHPRTLRIPSIAHESRNQRVSPTFSFPCPTLPAFPTFALSAVVREYPRPLPLRAADFLLRRLLLIH